MIQLDVQRSLYFELINVIYNLAALYSRIALNSHGADDVYKMAANYFSLAAGTIKHLQTDVIPTLNVTPPSDMDPYCLQSLENLMLAQAQEFVWQKAVKDGLKDMSIAKIAAKISDLFASAVELGRKTDGIPSQWIHHMKARHFHFAAVVQYRAACDCLDKRRYGEEVARLQDCLNCVEEGLKESKYVNREVVEAFNALKSKAQDDLKRAEKDNDIIYLMPVPSKFELKPIERILMVAPKVPPELSDPISKLGDHGELGRQLFSQLPPQAVKSAAESYERNKHQLINEQINTKLDELTTKMHEMLQALGLPSALDALDVPLGLPESLLAHSQEVRQQDGPKRIQRSIQETDKVKAQARRVFQEGLEILQAESAEDTAARLRYGTDRWSRQTSEEATPKLYDKVKQIEGYLAHAQSSDSLILNKLSNNERLILVLAGSEQDLRRYVPSSGRSTAPAAVVQAASKLRFSLKEVSRLESQRKMKIDALRDKAKHDDIRKLTLWRLPLDINPKNNRTRPYQGSC
jgi:programmed cell death 6-interacting protein